MNCTLLWASEGLRRRGCLPCDSVPVDDDDRLVADHPGVVPLGQAGHVAGTGDHLLSGVHPDAERRQLRLSSASLETAT